MYLCFYGRVVLSHVSVSLLANVELLFDSNRLIPILLTSLLVE